MIHHSLIIPICVIGGSIVSLIFVIWLETTKFKNKLNLQDGK